MAMDDLVPDLIEETKGIGVLERDPFRLRKLSDQYVQGSTAAAADIQADSDGQISRRAIQFRRQQHQAYARRPGCLPQDLFDFILGGVDHNFVFRGCILRSDRTGSFCCASGCRDVLRFDYGLVRMSYAEKSVTA
jgi:hypothetical protein